MPKQASIERSPGSPTPQEFLAAGDLQPKDRYTVPEVSALTGRVEGTVRRWIREGRLPALRIQSRYPWILRVSLEQFLREEGGSHE
jgi:excisionase family DNA binding protein